MIVNFPVFGKITKGLPDFTYDGTYEEHPASYYGLSGDYTVVAFLSSGTLRLSRQANIDVFLVGGGGGSVNPASNLAAANGYGGAGGGYTATHRAIKIEEVDISIGVGGNVNSGGGSTTFGDLTVNGGGVSVLSSYGVGGSNGGAYTGTNGGNGEDGKPAFGEDGATKFGAGGGAGAGGNVFNQNYTGGTGGLTGGGNGGRYQRAGTSATENTGSGAGGGGKFDSGGRYTSTAKGGSGIVLMRPAQ